MKQGLHLKNDLNTDFKVIAKAAELIESGNYAADQVAVLPAGPRQRAFSKDISSHNFYYSDSKRKECLNIEITREGLYDMLPEGLFHQPPTGSSRLSEEQMIEDVQLRRAEEKDARKFFMPFEAELNYLRTLMELYENRLDKKTTYNDLTRIFAAEWKEFDLLNKEQSIIWMHLLPVIHQKRNDIDFLGQFLTVLFNIPVTVTLLSTNLYRNPIHESMQFKLGFGTLGISTIIGDSFISDHEEVQINIGPAHSDQLVRFMPGTAQRHIVDLVVSYLVPVNTDHSVSLVANEQNRVGSLGENSNSSFLGYTVYL